MAAGRQVEGEAEYGDPFTLFGGDKNRAFVKPGARCGALGALAAEPDQRDAAGYV